TTHQHSRHRGPRPHAARIADRCRFAGAGGLSNPKNLDPLHATPARRAAGRVLGPLLPYLLHLRPAEWPILTGHLLTGWLLASGFRWPTASESMAIAAWVIGLNGGTLALNSAF